MGTKNCKQCKKVRIPSSDHICGDCYAAAANDMLSKLTLPDFKTASREVMEIHAGTLQKLAAFEAANPPAAFPQLTLPTDSATRKEYPLLRGCLRYFPAALAGVARISQLGNMKHNKGQELHHARGKSMDHGDCIVRHLIDLQDLLAASERGTVVTPSQILEEVNQLTWRALALSQELQEKFGNAPLAPGAKLDPPPR